MAESWERQKIEYNISLRLRQNKNCLNRPLLESIYSDLKWSGLSFGEKQKIMLGVFKKQYETFIRLGTEPDLSVYDPSRGEQYKAFAIKIAENLKKSAAFYTFGMMWECGDKNQAIEYFSAEVKPLIDEHLPYVAPLHIVIEPNSANAFCRRGRKEQNKEPQVYLNLKKKTLDLPWYELPEYYLHEQVHACQIKASDKGNSFWQTSENFGSDNPEERLANPMEYYARTIGKQVSSCLIASLNGQKIHV